MKQPLNSMNVQTSNVVDNIELIPLIWESVETIPSGSTLKRVEAGATLPSNVEGKDIVQSRWRHLAVCFIKSRRVQSSELC